MKKVLFIAPYPTSEAPSQRFRYEQYLDFLNSQNYQTNIAPYLKQSTWEILYQEGRFVKKTLAILGAWTRRWFMLFRIKRYDIIFIHREVKPMGLPILEWLICKLAKKVVYDFDDAIWLKNYSESNKAVSSLKRYSNVKKLCQWANVVSCGNDYLADYARQWNKHVVINPTTIDTEHYHNQIAKHNNPKPIVGWTGSHSTIRYLYAVYPVIEALEKTHDFEFRVISDLPPKTGPKSLNFIKWSKQDEIDTLAQLDIGIMPLEDDQWAKGKCGFKALQYMGLGIPAVTSPVGVNNKIIDHGKNGFLSNTPEEWHAAIETLLTDRDTLLKMGQNARKTIEESYSVKANQSNFLHLFD